MIFVDTNVLMYAVGRPHPLRGDARTFFAESLDDRATRLCTSAEVLQELLHAYIPVRRWTTLDAALRLAGDLIEVTWSIEPDDLLLARDLGDILPALGARDLLHVACCRRREVSRVQTYDRALAAAFA